ncbi:MAG TPA: hypothetical protein VFR81_00575 [Longimicrobium sp.]|nr:hypothetical protein [Longimicrobium sp.]
MRAALDVRPGSRSIAEGLMSNDPNESDLPHSARFVSFDEMDLEMAERMRGVAPAEPAPGAVRPGRQPAEYAVSDDPLPGGAVAAVVREAGANPVRLVVISGDQPADRALFLADVALDRDEEVAPEPDGRRLLLVGAGGEIVTHTAAGSVVGMLHLTVTSSRSRELIAPFLRAAEESPPAHVPGIGYVRIPGS